MNNIITNACNKFNMMGVDYYQTEAEREVVLWLLEKVPVGVGENTKIRFALFPPILILT